MKEMLDLEVLTVTGKTLGENLETIQKEGFFRRGEAYLANFHLNREDLIRPSEKSKGFGSIAVLKGILAPEGTVIKYSAIPSKMLTHEGPARVFDKEEALDAIMGGN